MGDRYSQLALPPKKREPVLFFQLLMKWAQTIKVFGGRKGENGAFRLRQERSRGGDSKGPQEAPWEESVGGGAHYLGNLCLGPALAGFSCYDLSFAPRSSPVTTLQ